MRRRRRGCWRRSCPVVDPAPLGETLFVPVHVLERCGDADVKNGFRGFLDTVFLFFGKRGLEFWRGDCKGGVNSPFVQKSHVLVKE